MLRGLKPLHAAQISLYGRKISGLQRIKQDGVDVFGFVMRNPMRRFWQEGERRSGAQGLARLGQSGTRVDIFGAPDDVDGDPDASVRDRRKSSPQDRPIPVDHGG